MCRKQIALCWCIALAVEEIQDTKQGRMNSRRSVAGGAVQERRSDRDREPMHTKTKRRSAASLRQVGTCSVLDLNVCGAATTRFVNRWSCWGILFDGRGKFRCRCLPFSRPSLWCTTFNATHTRDPSSSCSTMPCRSSQARLRRHRAASPGSRQIGRAVLPLMPASRPMLIGSVVHVLRSIQAVCWTLSIPVSAQRRRNPPADFGSVHL